MTIRIASLAIAIAAITAGSALITVQPASAHNGGANHSRNANFQSQLVISCPRMWRNARKIARDQARRHCTRQHGSYRRGQIRVFSWRKGVCDRRSGRADGTLSYACKWGLSCKDELRLWLLFILAHINQLFDSVAKKWPRLRATHGSFALFAFVVFLHQH